MTSARHSEGENDLYAYAQEAFGLSFEGHQRLLAKASEEKVRWVDFVFFFRSWKNDVLLLAANSHS